MALIARGPGKVDKGMVIPLPRDQTMEELAENLIVCPPTEMIDKLSVYAEAGIDEVYLPSDRVTTLTESVGQTL